MYARYIPPSTAKPQQDDELSRPPVEGSQPSTTPVRTSTSTPYARYVPPQQPKLNDAPTPASASKKITFNYDAEPEESSVKKRKLDVADQDAAGSGKKKLKKSKDKSREKGQDTEPEISGTKAGYEDLAGSSAPTISEEGQEKRRKKSKKVRVGSVGSEDEETKPEKSKKEKKKKKKRNSLDTASSKVEEPLGEIKTEIGDNIGESSEKKSKKTKKSASNATPTASNVLDDDAEDKVDERHKAVLKKKEKSLKRIKRAAAEDHDVKTEENREQAVDDVKMEEPAEVHGLEPLPQPELVAQDTSKLDYETLPPWLAAPIRVTATTTTSFKDLGIPSEAENALAAKGYKEAFAVQTAAIPLLMPSPDRQGDLVVSAATGSGKTLAYVLPIVRDISQGVVTRLRGLIVVPTRELVRQAQEVCEICSSAFSGPGRKRVKIGVSMGNQAFKTEQAALMDNEQRYDPEGYQKYLQERHELSAFEDLDSELAHSTPHDTVRPLPDHVMDYVSKVDILICTPGRLVEHINLTPGFTLDYVRWLVVDEADKLLAQSFQQWLDLVMEKLSVEKPGARDFIDSNKSGVRKVILSATMTRDLSLLNGLKLRRPSLVVLEGTKTDEDGDAEDKTIHVLPELLQETAIKVRDPDQKPLLLVDLLQSNRLKPVSADDQRNDDDEENQSNSADDTSSSGSESDSDEDSSSQSDSDDDFNEDSDNDTPNTRANTSKTPKTFRSTVLVFTKSNETALRLSRLLSILAPGFAPLIGTLTSTTRTSQRRKTLGAFASRKLRILIASDLVARGIDLTNLDHVVNYDMPTSVASYVHRVGRTARAGRGGHAWTLFTKTEAGWFWPEIAGQGKNPSKLGGVKRAQKVENLRFGGDEGGRFSEARVGEYEAALEKLGQEAGELRRRR